MKLLRPLRLQLVKLRQLLRLNLKRESKEMDTLKSVSFLFCPICVVLTKVRKCGIIKGDIYNKKKFFAAPIDKFARAWYNILQLPAPSRDIKTQLLCENIKCVRAQLSAPQCGIAAPSSLTKMRTRGMLARGCAGAQFKT